ncbi:MAG TPA: chromosome segregation protein SMC [Marinobacter hydrocarbonoclasticus]|uniref:chromosome segregation protein SMC n=1 Tax=unclassified Marinobacter TaxID=83889 RepID=UPI000C969992|nr:MULTISPECIES: chromosome segregation protein SMC [unclassified Marinobacter]MAC24274.1 chromosome segregation protein SMC [Marinobacter sp.]HAX11221.1 chromosome segregation protein SMC [Marinobacter nauticus]HCR45912.1 chromosome segregation protein SMC [Marinobacter nauticus]|tara:strand:+ start:1200 stop:4691 length:3492 start_codon:yes stop_codon:yes gene_type:complete
MRLKSIKLAGFKSFVDPTTVPFPSNMTAVVGPNGCGKSNIIDAVRWVMGESSAKYLRGESMTDVIFNGSSARKPVGQASIELVFDNSDGSAPGEFVKFNEISVKRRVSREGQSEYFLNGSKCRRRDITDLFLGTGLGPRSYAIIEQGMISRLIEAKPEELRVYIEEAAGISKYKERRRETENRIRRTQENLERLTDLREELGRQLQHLERQAAAAEKYKAYKQEEREKKAELTVLRWKALDDDLQTWRGKIRDTELELEKFLTERVNLETSLESLREDHHERTEHFNRAQARYYEAGADIARIEQSLEHQRERSRQTAAELDQALANERELGRELEQDEEKLATLREELDMIEPEQEALAIRSEESAEKLQQAEEAMSDWQHRWDEFSTRSSDARRQAELAQSRIRSLEDAIEQLKTRQQKLRDEQALLDGQLDRSELEQLLEEQETLELKREETAERIQQLQDQVYSSRQALREAEQSSSEYRQTVQSLKATMESQQALLDEQMGAGDNALQSWLADQGLTDAPRLAAKLSIEDGWEFAVEQVIGRFTQGLTLPEFDQLATALESAPKGFAVVSDGEAAPVTNGLAAKVSGVAGISQLLSSVYAADTLPEAMANRAGLAPGESIITRDGVWLSRDWLLMPDSDAAQVGVIERQKKVAELQAKLAEAEARLEQATEQLEQLQEKAERAETERDEAQARHSDIERELGALASRASGLKARAEQIDARLARIREDIADVDLALEEQQANLQEAREEWDIALASSEDSDEEKEQLLEQRDSLRENLDRLRQEARHDRDHAHQLQLQLQTLQSQRDGLQQTIDRMQMQKERLEERLDVLRESRESAEEPIEDLQLQLEGLLERRLAEEEKLSAARDALEEIDRQVRDREQGRSRTEHQVQEIRARLEKLKMESQALEIRSGNHIEQLKELNVKLQEVLEQLPEDAEEKVWAEELEKIGNRIQRLGAINLAAIEEYQVQSERKTYLDEQHNDLMEALETLDNAIRKIDRETRQRFKETFDQVNGGLQALFPKVFGGGNAYLELTGEDLLETGVAIMARPPGKKNSTIHLLSGGEKALTAIALVFSIFQLNPAPFCMLDEVDAPLDDANVGRYANMVKEMSKQVQFIYITHNKIAMEMADQLMGVTMHEPGCSRLVSVDVDEAAALAEA